MAAASLLILCAAPAQYLGRQHDDILYLIASHALASGGYGLLTSPGTPPLVMLTPGFPLLLLPITLLAGEWHTAHQIFCTLILAAVPWIIWAWLKRRLDAASAILIAMIFATSPLVLSQAGTVMTEGTYTLLMALILILMESKTGKTKAPWVGGLLLALIQVRPAGISAIPAVLARPLAERRWKTAAWAVLPAVVGLLLWSVWSYSVYGAVQELEEFSLSYKGHPWLHPFLVAWDNGGFFLSSLGSCFLPARWGSGAPALLAGISVMGLTLRGCWLVWKKNRSDPAVLMLVGGLLMHTIWAWHYERYLIPFLPWILWGVAHALGKRSAPILAVLLGCQVFFQTPRWLGKTAWSNPELLETYDWLKKAEPTAGILVSPLYVRDAFYTGKPSLPLPITDDSASFAQALQAQKVSFILWQADLDVGLSVDRLATIRKILEQAGSHLKDEQYFRVLYENNDENSRIYQLR